MTTTILSCALSILITWLLSKWWYQSSFQPIVNKLTTEIEYGKDKIRQQVARRETCEQELNKLKEINALLVEKIDNINPWISVDHHMPPVSSGRSNSYVVEIKFHSITKPEEVMEALAYLHNGRWTTINGFFPDPMAVVTDWRYKAEWFRLNGIAK